MTVFLTPFWNRHEAVCNHVAIDTNLGSIVQIPVRG